MIQSENSKASIVSVKELMKVFGDRKVVKGISFEIEKGECIALLGPNGAGKTTTINMLLGLVRPTSGEIKIFGLDSPKKLSAIKKRTGVAPQTDNLDPDLTVVENLITYGSYFGIRKGIALERAEELLHFLALSNRSNEIIQNLSGGQRRRLLIARALINRPELLILDEPTIGLDPQARHLIWERLEALRIKGTTMLLTSHYMEEVSRLATRVIIMDRGKILLEGKTAAMINDMVGSEVFEVTGSPEKLNEMQEMARLCDAKIEQTEERLYIYTKKRCPELENMALAHKHVTRRPANLEDLFLKLTGRRLRED